jgi:hypothetical protein
VTPTKELRAGLQVLVAIAETVQDLDREHPGEGVPSGPTMSALMTLIPGMTFGAYLKALDALQAAGLVRHTTAQLFWMGAEADRQLTNVKAMLSQATQPA